jgi:hypothetical protein
VFLFCVAEQIEIVAEVKVVGMVGAKKKNAMEFSFCPS